MRILVLLLALVAVAQAEPVTGPGEFAQQGGLYKLTVPAGWMANPDGSSDVMLRKNATGLQPRMSIRLERGGYTPTKASMQKDFEQFEKLFKDHKFKLVTIKQVKVGKMSGFRLVGTEKGPKIFTTHVMQKLAVPGGKVLDAHGRSEANSQKDSKAGSKELLDILDSMKS